MIDPKKLHLYCEQSVAHFHWLEALGVPFERSFYPGKAAIQPGTECLIWSGNENAWPFREQAKPAPRGCKVASNDMGGHLLMQKLIEAANELAHRIRHGRYPVSGRQKFARRRCDGASIWI